MRYMLTIWWMLPDCCLRSAPAAKLRYATAMDPRHHTHNPATPRGLPYLPRPREALPRLSRTVKPLRHWHLGSLFFRYNIWLTLSLGHFIIRYNTLSLGITSDVTLFIVGLRLRMKLEIAWFTLTGHLETDLVHRSSSLTAVTWLFIVVLEIISLTDRH